MFGIWTGAFAPVIFAAAGLSVILASSATAFSIVKWAGAAYLVWLGIQALRSKGDGFVGEMGGNPKREWQIFRQGMLVSSLNPKVAIFFLAFLPQFVEPGAGPAWAQLALHGTLIIVVAAIVEPPLVLAGARLAQALRTNQRLAIWLDRSLGALFVGFGVKLALSER